MLWTSFGEEEKIWANIISLVGLFEVEWKTPHHNIMVEFFKNWKLYSEHNIIKVMMVQDHQAQEHKRRNQQALEEEGIIPKRRLVV
jgi:hypothetical protein